MTTRMKLAVTIACTRPSHNRGPILGLISSTIAHCRNTCLHLILAALLAGGFASGCATSTSGPALVPTWELANAPPVKRVPLGRSRVSFDRPLPARLLQELSPEFSLVTIRTSRDWEEVRRRLDLPPASPAVDFSQGIVVGIVANIGDSVAPTWPIPIQQIRCREGQGCLEASFQPGLYHPLLCPSYVELAFAPGVRVVTRVHISHRKFVIPLGPNPN